MKEVVMDAQMTTIYEPPVLVELGEFGEDTLGDGGEFVDSFVDRF